MNFELMMIGTQLPPCMPFPIALTGLPVSRTAKVMYCRMLDAMTSYGQEDDNGILFICFPVPASQFLQPGYGVRVETPADLPGRHAADDGVGRPRGKEGQFVAERKLS